MGFFRRNGAIGAILALLVAGCATRAARYGDVEVTSGPARGASDLEDAAARSHAAIAIVETDVGRGMGFVIDPSGYLITNRHVVEDADHVVEVRFPAQEPPRRYGRVKIVYIDPERDLALLKIQTEKALPHLPLASRKVEPVDAYLRTRDEVAVLHSDDAHKFVADSGAVSQLAIYNPAAGPGAFVEVTNDVRRGQSGGPVLDRFGRAVGVVTWTWKDVRGGFAIPIAEATKMLSERPLLDSDDRRMARARERSQAFLAALGRGDVDHARKFTSPSHARRLREATIARIMTGIEDGGRPVMQGFVAALESLVSDATQPQDAFGGLALVVERTSHPAFRSALGVEEIEAEQVVSFFYEIGKTYVAARLVGQPPPEALLTAMRRLQTVDAARTFALAEVLGELAGHEVKIERVDVVPGLYQPRATVFLRSRPAGSAGADIHLTLHLRLEWGDWYVAEVARTPLANAPTARLTKPKA